MVDEYSISAPTYTAENTDPWANFFRVVIRKMQEDREKLRYLNDIKNTVNDLLCSELATFSAKWKPNKGKVVFESKDERFRFLLIYG